MESWSITSGGQEILIVSRTAAGPTGGARLDPRDACFRVLDWTSPAALSESALVGMIRVVEPHVQRVSDAPTSWLRSRLADALREGRLVAYVLPPRAFGVAVAEEKGSVQAAAPAPPPKEVKTWVAIRLVDENDQPVPYKRYLIELPDGSTREGILDDKGIARINDIDPGTCRVSFPQLDARAWKAA